MCQSESLSESSLSREVLSSSDEQSQNLSLKQILLLSQENMSDSTIHHNDDIQNDDDGSQEVSSSINLSLATHPKQEIIIVMVELAKINMRLSSLIWTKC